jgi:hypothetical protein
MSGFPLGKGCRPRRGPLGPSCSASHPPLECESDGSGPDFSHHHRIFNESEMRRSFECMPQCARKALDIAGIVREAIYCQLSDKNQGKSLLD